MDVNECKWEEESISPSCPSVKHIRCRYPNTARDGSLLKGVLNCIGHQSCADYEIKKEEK